MQRLARHYVAAACTGRLFTPQTQAFAVGLKISCCCYMTSDACNKDRNKDDEESSSWIPPARPLVGDKGLQTKGATVTSIVVNDKMENSSDWLQTRRSVMLKTTTTTTKASLDGGNNKNIPIKKHTLLSQNEITLFLQAMGGGDVKCFLDDPSYRRMGGADGIIIVTAHQNTHLHTIANALIQQLRLRKLQDVGVVGAQLGAEGGAIDNGDDEGWMVVDCDNFIVHIQEEHMRKAVNLEKLWSGKDDLHKLNFYLDEAVDDYVAANPVPDNYGTRRVTSSSSSNSGRLDWDAKVKKLQKSRWQPAATAAGAHRRDVRRTTKKLSPKKKRT